MGFFWSVGKWCVVDEVDDVYVIGWVIVVRNCGCECGGVDWCELELVVLVVDVGEIVVDIVFEVCYGYFGVLFFGISDEDVVEVDVVGVLIGLVGGEFLVDGGCGGGGWR